MPRTPKELWVEVYTGFDPQLVQPTLLAKVFRDHVLWSKEASILLSKHLNIITNRKEKTKMARVILNKVRISFMDALFAPKSFEANSPPRFGATFIIEPNSKNAKALDDAMKEVALAKWPKGGEKILEELIRKEKTAYGERDKLNGAGEPYQGFEGNYFVTAYNKTRPTVIDKDKSPLVASDGKPYGGCFVNAIIDIYAQDGEYGKRINASLAGVQFHSDGDAFGGGAPASPDQFPDLEDGSDDDDLI